MQRPRGAQCRLGKRCSSTCSAQTPGAAQHPRPRSSCPPWHGVRSIGSARAFPGASTRFPRRDMHQRQALACESGRRMRQTARASASRGAGRGRPLCRGGGTSRCASPSLASRGKKFEAFHQPLARRRSRLCWWRDPTTSRSARLWRPGYPRYQGKGARREEVGALLLAKSETECRRLPTQKHVSEADLQRPALGDERAVIAASGPGGRSDHTNGFGRCPRWARVVSANRREQPHGRLVTTCPTGNRSSRGWSRGAGVGIAARRGW
jgi:hypothetical protein